MRGIYGNPYLDLDSLVPLDLLDLTAIELELATVPRYNNVWGPQFPADFMNYMQPPASAGPRIREFYHQHRGDMQALQNFAKLHYQTYSPTWSVRLTDMDDSLRGKVNIDFQMAVDKPELWTKLPDIFPSVHRFIDQSQVFASTGRINFFITDHHCHTPEHTDYAHPLSNKQVGFTAAAEKEFLWISLRQIKAFYVLDDVSQVKHRVRAKCAWFNTLDMHGADPVAPQTWSLRIDGQFTPQFRTRMKNHFGLAHAF